MGFFSSNAVRVAMGIAALAMAGAASAQVSVPVPPDTQVLSPGKVDMRSGDFIIESPDLSVGPAGQSLDFIRIWGDPGTIASTNWQYFITKQSDGATGYFYTIVNRSVGRTWHTGDNITFQDQSFSTAGQSKLQRLASGSNKYFLYTTPDGTVVKFQPTTDGAESNADEITRPDGTRFSLTFDTGGTGGAKRLRRVSDNRGYVLILLYATADRISQVCAINAAVTTPPSTQTCPAGARSVSYAYNGNRISSVTDVAGQVSTSTMTYDSLSRPLVETFYRPGIAQPQMTLTYGGYQGLQRVVTQQDFTGGPSYSYSYDTYGSDFPNITTIGSGWTRNSESGTLLFWGSTPYNPLFKPVLTPGPARVLESFGRETTFTYKGDYTVVLTHQRNGGPLNRYSYGSAAQIAEIRSVPPTGSPDPEIATSYTYDCTFAVNCAHPITMTDPRGFVTDLTYDPVHGGLLTETQPAPTAGAVRPQRRNTYAQFFARYRNSAGTVVQAPRATWLPTQTSECRTLASCVGTADETRTTITYPSGSTGAFNLLPVSKTVASGDGTLSQTTSWTYDTNGDKLTEDGPRPGTADTTRWRYDLMRRVVGVIGPDPDGAGALRHGAVRNSYDPAGRLTRVERGTVASQSDVDWAAFTALDWTDNVYDVQDHLLKTTTSGSSGLASVTQMSYDSAGRLACRAVRMDPAQWASQTDPCVPQTSGPNGPDQVTRFTYDVVDRVVKEEAGVGTSIVADVKTNSWTLTDKLDTVTDANLNKTTYAYDGHDRLKTTSFPLPAIGANASSTTDYEQVGYDLSGNITSRRKRDGSTLTYSYNALNRMMVKIVPGATASTRDVYMDYDLQGHQLSARFDSQSGEGLTSAYGALGRLTSTTLNMDGVSRAFGYGYDIAGFRTSLTHPDGSVFTFAPDTLGRLTALTQSATALRGYSYDANGRLVASALGNGTPGSTTWGYDGIGRLNLLSHNIAGTAADVSFGFTYSPASQTLTQTRDNDSYAWTGAVALNRAYVTNGLNQYTAAGPASFTYDANGNLTGDGTNSYGYDVENRLVSATVGAQPVSLRYDPLGRLYEVAGASTTRFLYDGDELIGEYATSGALLRRYVHGIAVDDPVVWYEGSGLASTALRHLIADRQGSVIGIADSNGAIIARNTYDEYGIPKSDQAGQAVVGRFAYTGQIWLPELGMYHYKARLYSPTLGRFLQTDPTGYDDGFNWYAYVGNDPVNMADPSGTYGRGDGFSDDEWKKFHSAQEAAAGKLEKAADKLQAAVAAGGKAFEKASGKFERQFGKGTGTAENMSKVAGQISSMASALRDNGSGGHMATGMSGDAFATAGHSPGAMAFGAVGGTTMSVNLGHSEFGNGAVLGWATAHEAGHNVGLVHPAIRGITPYALGNEAQQALFERLPSINPGAAMANPDEVLLYSYGRVPQQ